jgi:hypothetical protein
MDKLNLPSHRGLMIEELQHALDSLFNKYGKLNPRTAQNFLIHAITAREIIERAVFWRLTPADIEGLIKAIAKLHDDYLNFASKGR